MEQIVQETPGLRKHHQSLNQEKPKTHRKSTSRAGTPGGAHRSPPARPQKETPPKGSRAGTPGGALISACAPAKINIAEKFLVDATRAARTDIRPRARKKKHPASFRTGTPGGTHRFPPARPQRTHLDSSDRHPWRRAPTSARAPAKRTPFLFGQAPRAAQTDPPPEGPQGRGGKSLWKKWARSACPETFL